MTDSATATATAERSPSDSRQSPEPNSPRAWLLATRPATLPAAVAPVLTGTAVAFHEGHVRLLPGVAVLVGATLLQIGSNFANDVFDYEKGADTSERLGPLRAVHAGLVSPRQMKVGMAIVFGIALCVGVYLTAIAGWPIVAIGLASILSAIAYTGGPYPLGYHGLGDVFVMLFFGFVAVGGTVFVHLGALTPLALVAALPLGALATNILVVNNLRDRHTDRGAGKRTLAVRFGRRGAEIEYLGMLLAAYLTPVLLLVTGSVHALILLPLLTLPLALRNARQLHTLEGRALNPLLGKTAQLVFFYALLFAVGLAAGGVAQTPTAKLLSAAGSTAGGSTAGGSTAAQNHTARMLSDTVRTPTDAAMLNDTFRAPANVASRQTHKQRHPTEAVMQRHPTQAPHVGTSPVETARAS